MDYKRAGVDIEAGYRSVVNIGGIMAYTGNLE